MRKTFGKVLVEIAEQDPSHRPLNAEITVKAFKNVRSFFPKNGTEARAAMLDAWKGTTPAFISLKRDNG